MSKVFDREVEAWSGLYASDGEVRGRRYALFQKSAERRVKHRLALALQLLDLQPGTRLLDLACGSGVLGGPAVEAGARWVGVDISRQMVARGRAQSGDGETRAWINANAAQIPLRDASFDAVACIGMLNFHPRSRTHELLREMHRVLRPEGMLVLSALRLDVLTWLRSRLHPHVPLPISSPGPLFHVPHAQLESAATRSGFRCERTVHVRKYLGVPHYALFKLVKRVGG